MMQEKRHIWLDDKDTFKLKCLLVCDNQKENILQINKKLNDITRKLFGKEKSCCDQAVDVDYELLVVTMEEWLDSTHMIYQSNF